MRDWVTAAPAMSSAVRNGRKQAKCSITMYYMFIEGHTIDVEEQKRK
jgi:hypothetical protein